VSRLFFLLILILSNLNCDMPPEDGYHINIQNTYVININQYTKYEILACPAYTGVEPMGCYKLSNNQKIEKGYKYNTVYLLAIEKKILNNFGDISATNIEELEDASKLSIQIAQYAIDKNFDTIKTVGYAYIKDKYPISEESYDYKIENITGNQIMLKLKKRIITFISGKNNIIEY